MTTEISQRSLDLNTAGTTGQEIMTAYREQALRMAYLLSMHGPVTVAELRKFTSSPKTLSTLYRNVYGWFERLRLCGQTLQGDRLNRQLRNKSTMSNVVWSVGIS